MDKKIKTKFEDEKTQKEEEEDEALSLCDLPLNSGEPPADRIDSTNFKTQDYKRRSSSEPSEFFEFFHGFVSDEISDADDIIFRGKILPYYCKSKNRQPRTHNNHHGGGHIHRHQILIKSLSADDANYTNDDDRLPRRYFELTTTPNTHRRREATSDTHRSSSKISSAAKSEGWKVISKSKWIGLMMFGPVKIQQEMDLRDMKNRQIRRPNTGSMFAGGKVPARGNERRRNSWGHDLIRFDYDDVVYT
ncbi:PREDICTED: uncharacterized protein LOC105976523 [Erythranthe guttata]|uniref:uncharacterized protein LOC105976523 n=1 Tax=Erythranthe guttata TaxID=4155 RepID=UPI00064E03D9|nr:PREDICTED: uncharacterized protein LOC105976523 [Erythranthe guttata]|eukprot:XP_012857212.1 PREDICTED: uncharacterized protein LOC105976523 [Erythranthe guttata]